MNEQDLPWMETAGTRFDPNYDQLTSYNQTAGTTPEQIAEVDDLSKQSGIDPTTISKNIEVARDGQRQPDWEDLREKNPVLHKRSASPSFVARAREDYAALSGLEDIEKPSATPARLGKAAYQSVAQGISLWAEGKSLRHIESMKRKYRTDTPEWSEHTAKRFNWADQAEYDAQYWQYTQDGNNHEDAQRLAIDDVREKNNEWGDLLKKFSDLDMLQYTEEMAESSSGFAENMFKGVFTSLPTMAAQGVNPVLGVSAIYDLMFASKYEESMALLESQGKSKDEAHDIAIRAAETTALGSTPIEFAGNLVSFLFFKRALKAGSASKFLGSFFKSSLGEAGEEYLQTFPDELGTIIANNPDASSYQLQELFVDEIAEIATSKRAAYNALLGFAGGGFMTSVGGAIGHPLNKVKKKKQAKRLSRWINELETKAGLSTMREHSPEEFASFVQEIAGENENVFLQADILEDIAADMDVEVMDLAELYGVSEGDMQYAIDTGTDITIPVGKLVTNMPENNSIQFVKGHLKTAPDGVDLANEVEQDKDDNDHTAREQDKVIKEQRRAIAKEERDYLTQKLKAQVTNLQSQLTDVGYTEADAEVSVALYEARAATWSKATGKHASLWFERNGISVQESTFQTDSEVLMSQVGGVTMESIDDTLEIETLAVTPDGSVVKAMVGARSALSETDSLAKKLKEMLEDCL